MSPPIQSTRSEGAFHGSSQYAAVDDLEDTAMFVADVHAVPGSVATETATSGSGTCLMPGSATTVSSKSPNATFQRSQSRGRSRSVSPIIRCVRPPVCLSVVQCHTQLAKQIVASVISAIGRVAAPVQTAQGVAEAALSEAASVCGQVEDKIQSYVSRTEADASRVVGEATQQLEKEVQAAASGAVAMNT